MKITEDLRQYAAEQGIAEEEALKKGMEEKAREFTEKGAELSPQQYMQACDAHKEGKAIRIFGVPEKAGKFWTLAKAHDFAVLNKG